MAAASSSSDVHQSREATDSDALQVVVAEDGEKQSLQDLSFETVPEPEQIKEVRLKIIVHDIRRDLFHRTEITQAFTIFDQKLSVDEYGSFRLKDEEYENIELFPVYHFIPGEKLPPFVPIRLKNPYVLGHYNKTYFILQSTERDPNQMPKISDTIELFAYKITNYEMRFYEDGTLILTRTNSINNFPPDSNLNSRRYDNATIDDLRGRRFLCINPNRYCSYGYCPNPDTCPLSGESYFRNNQDIYKIEYDNRGFPKLVVEFEHVPARKLQEQQNIHINSKNCYGRKWV